MSANTVTHLGSINPFVKRQNAKIWKERNEKSCHCIVINLQHCSTMEYN